MSSWCAPCWTPPTGVRTQLPLSNPMRLSEGRPNPRAPSHAVPRARPRSFGSPARSRKAPAGRYPRSPRTPEPSHSRGPVAHGPRRYAPPVSLERPPRRPAGSERARSGPLPPAPSTRSPSAAQLGYPTGLYPTGADSRCPGVPLFRHCYHWQRSRAAQLPISWCRSCREAYTHTPDEQRRTHTPTDRKCSGLDSIRLVCFTLFTL